MKKYKVCNSSEYMSYNRYPYTIKKRWLFVLWVDTNIYMTSKEDALKYADYLNNREKIND